MKNDIHFNTYHIVVVGGGFAGLNLIKKLRGTSFRVTIIDKNNYHQFPPLFYQIASSGLEPASICFPFRKELKKISNIRFCLAELIQIHPERNQIETTAGNIHYDMLILSTGVETNFFGNDRIKTYAFGLKSTSESIALRNQILKCFERASSETSLSERKSLLTFFVVGGGPTGVEVAGALAEFKKYVLPREYPEIDSFQMRIVLVEGSDRLLRTMSTASSNDAAKYLKELGVEIRLNQIVSDYDGEMLTFANGEHDQSYTVIWGAGIAGSKFKGLDLATYDRGNRIIVDQFNQVTPYPNIFALGDIAMIETESYPHGHPQVAQVAIQQAETLSKNIKKGSMIYPFVYKDKGSMATVGRNRAVVDLKVIHINGAIAWLIWLFIHLISILGMKNKLFIFYNWMWNYFTNDTSLRLIIRPLRHPFMPDVKSRRSTKCSQ